MYWFVTNALAYFVLVWKRHDYEVSIVRVSDIAYELTLVDTYLEIILARSGGTLNQPYSAILSFLFLLTTMMNWYG